MTEISDPAAPDDAADDFAEYEELRPETSGFRKLLIVLAVVGVALLLVVGVTGWWVMRQLNPSGAPGDEISLTIPSGSSTSSIADLLEGRDIVANATVFRYYLKVKSEDSFQAGDFVFRENSAAWDALSVLKAGPLPPPFQQFTVPEGLTVPEIVAKISEGLPALTPDALNQALASGQFRSAFMPEGSTDYEGFLFPETYRVEEGEDANAVIAKMLELFDQVAAQAGLPASEDLVGLDPYEVITIASLIQEEAKVPTDMAKISRVIYNRLEQGIPLGIDATLCYEKAEKPCQLTKSDLAKRSPYNSRLVAGLPPTPIAAPGRAALEAAMSPADGPWLYYVLDPEIPTPGEHFFTDDFDEFNRAKARCAAAGLGCG